VVVTVGGVTSQCHSVYCLDPASITSPQSTSGAAGTSITIAGTNFGATQGTSTVTFNGPRHTNELERNEASWFLCLQARLRAM